MQGFLFFCSVEEHYSPAVGNFLALPIKLLKFMLLNRTFEYD